MMTINIQTVDIPEILACPGTRFAVKRTFAEWLNRDPVDNVHDAQLLLSMFLTRLAETEAKLNSPMQ